MSKQKKSKEPIITRFPPEPSGYLHAGHLKAMYTNLLTAEKSGGHTILRFDDTNPSTSKQEYVDNIISVLKEYDLLKKFKNGENPSFASDYFDEMLNSIEFLLSQGDAYIDESSAKEIFTQRHLLKPSPYRESSIEYNLGKWFQFKNGKLPTAICRLKISYNSPNAALRDPIVYRYNNEDHYRTGDKYKIYPTYDIACPVADSIDGITMAMRTSEFNERNDLAKWFFKKIPLLRQVKYISYSRLSFEYSILSKRKIRELIEKKIVEDWDDPRLDTLVAELRKGIVPLTWYNYFSKHGVSTTNSVEEWDKIYSINRKIIDNTSFRITALSQNTWELDIEDLPFSLRDDVLKEVPWSPKDKDNKLGNKEIFLSDNLLIDNSDAKLIKEDDLVYLLNFRVIRIVSIDKENRKMKGVCYNEEFHFKDIPWKISWLTRNEINTPVKTTYYQYLITKQTIAKDENVDDYLNIDSKKSIDLLLSHNKKVLKKGMIIQLVRFGFYIVDSVEPLNLIFIKEPGNKLQYLLDELKIIS